MKKKVIIVVVVILLLLGVFGGICLYQFTEVFGKKVFPTKIDSIVVRYAPGYSLTELDEMNTKEHTVIEVQEVKITGDELQYLKKNLKTLKEDNTKSSEAILDDYEVIVNKKIVMKVNENIGYVNRDKSNTRVKLPNSILNTIQDIIDRNNEEILESISFENITLKLNGASISVKEKENIEYLQKYLSYYPISLEENYKTYKDGYDVEIILNPYTRIYLYGSNVGYIFQNEGEIDTSTFVVFPKDLYHLIEQIYNTSIEK